MAGAFQFEAFQFTAFQIDGINSDAMGVSNAGFLCSGVSQPQNSYTQVIVGKPKKNRTNTRIGTAVSVASFRGPRSNTEVTNG